MVLSKLHMVVCSNNNKKKNLVSLSFLKTTQKCKCNNNHLRVIFTEVQSYLYYEFLPVRNP